MTVLTGYPNYPEGQIFTEFKTAPEKFKNFNGADIIRVPIFARGQSKARLLANYISFLLSLCIVGTFKTKNLKFDIVFVFGVSPPSVALPALLLAKYSRVPSAMWVLDIWPETLQLVRVGRIPFFQNFYDFSCVKFIRVVT